MSEIKVNVIIAGRTYPLKVKDAQEEEGMRKAAKHINDLIAKFEQSYAVADKQDVLAMCALQFASQTEQKEIDKENLSVEVESKLIALDALLKEHLNS